MPLFVQYGDDIKFVNRILTLIVCVMSVVIMILGVFAVKQRIIYVNPSQVIGSAYVGYVPEEAVGYFGATFLGYLGNSNQYSVKEQYQTAYLLMAPRLQSAMKHTLEQEMNEIQKSDMSIQTTPTEVQVAGDGGSYTVTIEAARMSFVYGQETKREKIKYKLICQKTATRKWNPFGLEVVSYDSEVVSSGKALAASANQNTGTAMTPQAGAARQ